MDRQLGWSGQDITDFKYFKRWFTTSIDLLSSAAWLLALTCKMTFHRYLGMKQKQGHSFITNALARTRDRRNRVSPKHVAVEAMLERLFGDGSNPVPLIVNWNRRVLQPTASEQLPEPQ